MIIFYANGQDISKDVEFRSLQLSDQNNNRRNTARFTVLGRKLEEATKVEIFRGSYVPAGVSAGGFSVVLNEDFPQNFFRVGDKIILGYKTARAERLVISAKNWRTLTFSSAVKYAHPAMDLCGKVIFRGVTMKNPQEEIGKSDIIQYSVDCSDNSVLLDTHNIVDTYENMYAREIIGRAVYLFSADDARYTLSDVESTTGIVAGGVALAPAMDGNNKIFKNNSLKIGASGAGLASYLFSWISQNNWNFDRFRAWVYVPDNPAVYASSLRFRAKNVDGSYFEWIKTFNDLGGYWLYADFLFADAVIFGNPTISWIISVEVVVNALTAFPAGTFRIDHIFLSSGGFSIAGVQRWNILFRDVRVQYKKPTTFFESLAKNDGYSWYVDNDNVIQYFNSESRPAPFNIIAPTGKNYWKLKVSADITNLKNRQVVRGGIAPSEFPYEQRMMLLWKETSYRLDYSPKNLEIYTSADDGQTFQKRTVGVENLVADDAVEFLFNFSEKTVRNGSIQEPFPLGTILKMVYNPYKDVRVQVQDDVSISRMRSLLGGDGIFDGAVINDASFRTFDEARARAKAELKAYANPVLTGSFSTEEDGLEVGQVIRLRDPSFDLDDDFVVQKLTKKVKDFTGAFVYDVTVGTTLYGLTEFFQYLLKMSGGGIIDDGEVVDNVTTIPDVVMIVDAVTPRTKSAIYYAHGREAKYSYNLSFTEGGTPNDAYADFSVAS